MRGKQNVLNDGMRWKGIKTDEKTFLDVTDIYLIIKCLY